MMVEAGCASFPQFSWLEGRCRWRSHRQCLVSWWSTRDCAHHLQCSTSMDPPASPPCPLPYHARDMRCCCCLIPLLNMHGAPTLLHRLIHPGTPSRSPVGRSAEAAAAARGGGGGVGSDQSTSSGGGGPAHGSASSASPPSSSPSGLPSAENERAKTVHAELSTTRTPPGGLLSNGPAGTHTSAGAGASASASASESASESVSASESASASRSLPSLKPIRGGGAGAAEAAAEKDATGLGSSDLGAFAASIPLLSSLLGPVAPSRSTAEVLADAAALFPEGSTKRTSHWPLF